jgi:2',3'-cyclic-nucleotide 2'-phosphodiesterase (5'-nucleotidase family)
MKKIALLLVIVSALSACYQSGNVTSKVSKIHLVDSTYDLIQDTQYLAYIAPIKAELENQLNKAIGYAPQPLGVYQPECPMLNWATDALWAMAKKYYPGNVDIAVVNIGGMRCNWGQGDITLRHVFELMPFDNQLVVLTLKGEDILALCQSFVTYGGQGVAGLRMTAVDGQLAEVSIGGKPVDANALYTVATSDYLAGGTDHMDALKNHVDYWNSGLLVRDLYVQSVKADTIHAIMDGRMAIL